MNRATIENLDKPTKKKLKRFERRIVEDMPDDLKVIWNELPFRYRLFCIYFFESDSRTEAAIKAGYPHKSAYSRAWEAFKICKPIIAWLEDEIVHDVADRVIDNSICSREMVLEKLTSMLIPDVGDLEDYETAKKNGHLAAVKEVDHVPVYDEDGTITGHKPVIKKSVDQKAVAMAIADICGYKAATKTELTGKDGVALAPAVIQVVMKPKVSETEK